MSFNQNLNYLDSQIYSLALSFLLEKLSSRNDKKTTINQIETIFQKIESFYSISIEFINFYMTTLKLDHQESVFQSIFSKFLINLPQNDYKDIYRICCHCQKAYYYYQDHIIKQPIQNWGQSRILFLRKLKKFAEKFKISSFSSIKPELILQKMSELKPVCGAIIFNLNQTKVLVIKSNGSKLGFPKGKINQFQTLQQCASREVQEQVGLFIHNKINPLRKVQFVTRQTAKSTFFLVKGISEQQNIRVQKNEIDDAFWIKIADLTKLRLRLVQRCRQAWDLYLKQSDISEQQIKIQDFIGTYFHIPTFNDLKMGNQSIKIVSNPLLNFKFDKQKLMSVFK